MGQDVYAELDKVFRFKYRDTKRQVLHLYDPLAQEIYVKLMVFGRGFDEKAVREDLRRRKAGELDEACVYCGDVIPEYSDYIVFVPRVYEITEMVLGEDVTHGEQMTQHIRDGCSYDEFLGKFVSPTREFIGMLGLYIIANQKNNSKNGDRFAIENKPPRFLDGDVIQDDLDHWIGYEAAAQMLRTRKEIPFRGLFHAESQDKVWAMTKEIVTPSLGFQLPDDADRDKVYGRVTSTLEECGLDITFEFA